MEQRPESVHYKRIKVEGQIRQRPGSGETLTLNRTLKHIVVVQVERRLQSMPV